MQQAAEPAAEQVAQPATEPGAQPVATPAPKRATKRATAKNAVKKLAESTVRVPNPAVCVPCNTGAHARSGGARVPSGVGRESERVSKTKPSKITDPQGSQAGAFMLNHFSKSHSELVLSTADSSKDKSVPKARIADFSKKNANCQMNSSDESVHFSN